MKSCRNHRNPTSQAPELPGGATGGESAAPAATGPRHGGDPGLWLPCSKAPRVAPYWGGSLGTAKEVLGTTEVLGNEGSPRSSIGVLASS